MLSSVSRWGGFNGPDSVITGCRHNAAASTLSANSIHLHFQEQRPYHWWIVIIREWQSTETTEAWAAKCVCAFVCTPAVEEVSSQIHTAAPDSRIIYYNRMNTERWDGEELWVREQGCILHTHTHTHTQINTQNTRTEYVYVFTNTHKQFGSLWPRHTERLWLNSPAFYSMLLTLLRLTHRHTHSYRSGHRLQPNTKPQAVIEADWPAPLYFQSIYSVHPGLYILIMCSTSFPKRSGDGVCQSGTGAAAGHWNEALPVFMGPPAQPLHHYTTFKLWTKTQWMPCSLRLSWRNAA